MDNHIEKFVSKFDSLTESEVKLISQNIPVGEYKKGSILLREGEITHKCYFVLKGCVRQYSLIDGQEKTTAFITEEQSVVSFISFTQQKPSEHYLSCVEDCILIIGSLNKEQDMYKQFPKLQSITRALMEQDFGKTQMELTNFITSSPEERYLHLLKNRPDLFQRVPLNQIASYLGMQPQSLSRIRKRISSTKL